MPLTLYHNNGDGTFTDVSEKSGFAKLIGRALGLVTVDVNDDGWPDLFVARDASPNLLLLNKQNGTFEDFAVDAGLPMILAVMRRRAWELTLEMSTETVSQTL